jgi:hypothetical protein
MNFYIRCTFKWTFRVTGLRSNFCTNRTVQIVNLKRFGEKKNIAACKRILCAGRSPILAKKEVFLKNSK